MAAASSSVSLRVATVRIAPNRFDLPVSNKVFVSVDLSRAIEVDLGGTRIPVIHLDDLIIGKILAGRPKDIEDVKNLWTLHASTVDRERVVQVLTLLEEALSQSDLIPAFEAVARRRP